VKQLPELCNITTGKLDANAAVENGIYPYFTCGEEPAKINEYAFDCDAILIAGNNAQGNFHVSRYNGKFNAYQRTYVLTAKENCNLDFVYYSLKLSLEQLRTRSQGSQTKFLTMPILNAISINDALNQKKIADVLSCIDDKIALNNKTNTELENMAKTIYDYWFTQFDFPDKNDHPYKTSGGQMVYNKILKREIPAWWEVKRLGDVCEIVLGGTPSTDKDEYWNGNIPWLNSGEVAEFPIINAEKTVTELGIKDSATELVPAGTVTLSITRHLRPSILTMDACINQSVVGIKENEIISKNFLYPFIASKINHYMMLRTGAQQPHINKETVDDTLVCIPFAEVLENYNKEVGSIYERIILNAKETKQLTMLRDYLLPLLMNGQIEVK
jgi:type I restriction enzyme S subunit